MRRSWVLDCVTFELSAEPGRTALELTRAVFGQELLYSRFSIQVRRLLKEGKVRRECAGNRRDPFRYFPVEGNCPETLAHGCIGERPTYERLIGIHESPRSGCTSGTQAHLTIRASIV